MSLTFLCASSWPSRVDRCAHRAADNAVVATASVHSTGGPHYAHTQRRTGSRFSVLAMSTVARASSLRETIHLHERGSRVRGRARSSADSNDRIYLPPRLMSLAIGGRKGGGGRSAARRHPDDRRTLVARRGSLGRMSRILTVRQTVRYISQARATGRSFAPNENRYGRGGEKKRA